MKRGEAYIIVHSGHSQIPIPLDDLKISFGTGGESQMGQATFSISPENLPHVICFGEPLFSGIFSQSVLKARRDSE